jgi:hypothetical protein
VALLFELLRDPPDITLRTAQATWCNEFEDPQADLLSVAEQTRFMTISTSIAAMQK